MGEGGDGAGDPVQFVDRARAVAGGPVGVAVCSGGGDVDVLAGGVVEGDAEDLAELGGAPFVLRAGGRVLEGDLVVAVLPCVVGAGGAVDWGGAEDGWGGIPDDDDIAGWVGGREDDLIEADAGAGVAGGDGEAGLEREEVGGLVDADGRGSREERSSGEEGDSGGMHRGLGEGPPNLSSEAIRWMVPWETARCRGWNKGILMDSESGGRSRTCGERESGAGRGKELKLTMGLREEIEEMGQRARRAGRELAVLTSGQKRGILLARADGLEGAEETILAANAVDVAGARERGLGSAMVDRLTLNHERVAAMARGVREVAELPDPVGEVLASWERPNGLRMEKVRVPIGVIGIIFESRPNVTSDAAALCFKSGNATILRGGSEAIHSNRAIASVLQESGERAGLPAWSIQLVANTDRESVRHLAEMDRYLDLIIPRGGKGLIETVVSLARMPVIKHYDGICHVYVDRAADVGMAVEIIVNAKAQKPGVCNAAETLLVDEVIAERFFAVAVPALRAKGVELRGDEWLCGRYPDEVRRAEEKDWDTEHLDLILNVRTVAGMDEAMDHIAAHGSRHSECIVTEDAGAAERFLAMVDSAAVFWNASTRFNDGGEFGFGCEIGISTDKLHARGPMGLPELTIYKYLVRGSGQVRG